MAMLDGKEGKWITTDSGSHVFIAEGQTLDAAMSDAGFQTSEHPNVVSKQGNPSSAPRILGINTRHLPAEFGQALARKGSPAIESGSVGAYNAKSNSVALGTGTPLENIAAYANYLDAGSQGALTRSVQEGLALDRASGISTQFGKEIARRGKRLDAATVLSVAGQGKKDAQQLQSSLPNTWATLTKGLSSL